MMDDTRAYYRRCFSSTDGRKVLAHLLADMGLFDTTGDTELKNYAAKIMIRMGFTNTPYGVEQLIDKCFEIQQIERKPDAV
jgi:hypothetical protein